MLIVKVSGGSYGGVYLAGSRRDAVAEGIAAGKEGKQLLPAWGRRGQVFAGAALGPLPLLGPRSSVTCGSIGPAAPWVQRAVTEDVVHHCTSCPSGLEHYSDSCQAARRHGNEQEQGKRGGRAHLGKVTASSPEFHQATRQKQTWERESKNPSDWRIGKLPVLIKRSGSSMQQPSCCREAEWEARRAEVTELPTSCPHYPRLWLQTIGDLREDQWGNVELSRHEGNSKSFGEAGNGFNYQASVAGESSWTPLGILNLNALGLLDWPWTGINHSTFLIATQSLTGHIKYKWWHSGCCLVE